MGIRELRVTYKPFEYPQFERYLLRGSETMWRPDTVNMKSDIDDWNCRTTDDEKEAIRLALLGFTQLELYVEDYWRDIVPKLYPKPEIKDAASMNAAFEAVHASAYAHLFDSLGFSDYEGFLKNPVIKKKLDYFMNHSENKISTALFAAGERISLFSIFAWLLSLRKEGRFKGLGQIISWSARDEHMHGLMGTDLINILNKEEGFTEENKVKIHECIQTVVSNEIDFIEQLYGNNRKLTVDKSSLIDYTKSRANKTYEDFEMFSQLELDNFMFKLNGKYKEFEWFEAEIKGLTNTDFFSEAVNGGGYISVLSQDFNSFDYSVFKSYSKI